MEAFDIAKTKVVWLVDFWKFVTECLGHSKNEGLEWGDLSQEHKDLCRFLQFDEHRFKLIMMPRYSLKSCIVTIAYSLWSMAHNHNIRILVYSAAAKDSLLKVLTIMAIVTTLIPIASIVGTVFAKGYKGLHCGIS